MARHVRGAIAYKNARIVEVPTADDTVSVQMSGHKLLMRVKTGTRHHRHHFFHHANRLGVFVERLEQSDAWGQFTWFEVSGTASALCELNEMDVVVESSFVINVRIPYLGTGAGNKLRPRPLGRSESVLPTLS